MNSLSTFATLVALATGSLAQVWLIQLLKNNSVDRHSRSI